MDEEFNDLRFKDKLREKFGVFFRQGAGPGNAPCLNLFKSLANPEELKRKNPECGDYIIDLTKQITR